MGLREDGLFQSEDRIWRVWEGGVDASPQNMLVVLMRVRVRER